MNVCIIPAKGNSSRIPHKNRRNFFGKPIIAYSIDTARQSRLFDSIVVSTDDMEMSEIAQSYGADVLIRPVELCKDQYGPIDVARHSIGLMSDVSKVCIVYATAPMMTMESLVRGYRALDRNGTAYSISIGVEPLHDAAQFIWAYPWALRDRVEIFGDRTVLIQVDPATDCDINTDDDWNRAVYMYETIHNLC